MCQSGNSSDYVLPPDVAAYEKAHNISSDNQSMDNNSSGSDKSSNSGGSSVEAPLQATRQRPAHLLQSSHR